MSEDRTTEDSSLLVGIGPRGVMLRVTEGETSATTYLDIDQAYAHVGHVQAAAITLEQSAYVQQRMEQQQAADMLRKIKSAKPGDKLWTP